MNLLKVNKLRHESVIKVYMLRQESEADVLWRKVETIYGN